MEAKRHEFLRERLGAFSPSMLQDFVTFSSHCKKQGIDISEIQAFILTEIEEGYVAAERLIARKESLKKLINEKMPRCPFCDSPLDLEPINNAPGRVIGGEAKSWWVCSRLSCEFDPILHDREPWQILAELGIPIHKPFKPVKSKPPQQSGKRTRNADRQRNCGKRKEKL